MAFQKSKQHIAFAVASHPDGNTTYEFYVVGGDIHRAPVDNPVMVDGNRSGRFECPDGPENRAYLAGVWNADFGGEK